MGMSPSSDQSSVASQVRLEPIFPYRLSSLDTAKVGVGPKVSLTEVGFLCVPPPADCGTEAQRLADFSWGTPHIRQRPVALPQPWHLLLNLGEVQGGG